MRRKENEITEQDAITDIIEKAGICHLAMCDNGRPYVVPVSFGFKNNQLYIHSSPAGKKVDILGKNNNVCVEFDIESRMVKTDRACNWGFSYKSVIGYGTAHFVHEYDKKVEALNIIMVHYSDGKFKYDNKSVDNCLIIKIDLKELTGKQSQ